MPWGRVGAGRVTLGFWNRLTGGSATGEITLLATRTALFQLTGVAR